MSKKSKETMEKLIAVITPKLIEGVDIDDILDKRDSKEFDAKWIEEYCKVCDLSKNIKFPKGPNYRKIAFFKAADVGLGELSSYISDDFAFILASLEFEYKSAFITKMIEDYLNGKIFCEYNEESK